MDLNIGFYVETRILAPNAHEWWYSLNKVVDVDITNFRDLDAEIVDKYPYAFDDVVKLFHFCVDNKLNIEVTSDR